MKDSLRTVGPHLESSCKRVLISQMGLVAVMAVNPRKFRGEHRFRKSQKHLENTFSTSILYKDSEDFTKQDQFTIFSLLLEKICFNTGIKKYC